MRMNNLNFRGLILVSACLFVLSGCQLMAMQRAVSEQGVLPPSSLNEQVSGLYQLVLQTEEGGQTQRRKLQLVVESQADAMQLAVLTPQGLRLFVATVRGSTVDDTVVEIERHAALDDRMETLANLIVKDVQRAYWPIDAFAETATRITVSSDNAERQVFDGERKVALVRYKGQTDDTSGVTSNTSVDTMPLWQFSVSIQQLLLDYTLILRPLDVQVSAK